MNKSSLSFPAYISLVRGNSSVMAPLRGSSLPVCPRNRHCAQWARIYMKYCLCSVKDGVSFSLGLVSVVSWGVAEVPQIITNYKEKSTEGLSIAFLMTWIVGDLFNLFGCMLEPATLPTQYYMAMLYTATTVILAAQTIYYGHIYHRLKGNKNGLTSKTSKHHQSMTTAKSEQNDINYEDFNSQDNQTNGSNVAVERLRLPSSPIPVNATVLPHYGSRGRDLYYMSARSLSKSRTPTTGSYLAHSHDYARTPPISILDQNSTEEPLLSGLVSMQSAPPLNTKSMLCSFSALTFFLGSFDLHLSVKNRVNVVMIKPPRGVVINVSRKLLQSNSGPSVNFGQVGGGSRSIGTFLGWGMAAIYMGGRLPQIFLNIRRGNVEGLNPLMFIFALVGNVTYLARYLFSLSTSIVVTTEIQETITTVLSRISLRPSKGFSLLLSTNVFWHVRILPGS